MNTFLHSPLYTATHLGDLALRNRIVMAPLTRCRAAQGDMPTPLMATYYQQRATAGLIVSEGVQISPRGKGYVGTPGIYTEAQSRAWRRITSAVHARGGLIVLQLWHVGRASHSSLQPGGALPVAPSALAIPGRVHTPRGKLPFETPHALTVEEIDGVVEEYRHAARLAMDAGFDGVEIHGANGYLLDQFLRDGANRRTDAYGGSVQNRARLLLRVVDAVTSVWPASRVGVRLSPNNPFNGMRDSNPFRTFSYAMAQLDTRGLAYLHLVEHQAGLGQPEAGMPMVDVQRLLPYWHGAYVANDGYTGDSAAAAVSSGRARAVAFGVPFIGNPDVVARLAEGAALRRPDPATLYGGGAHGYTDYAPLAA